MPSRAICATLVLVTLQATAGCSGELVLTDPSGEPVGVEPGDRPDAGVASAAEAAFSSDILPLLTASRPKGTCVTCHQGVTTVGPGFLGAEAADNYATLVANAVIGDSPETSRFLTLGEHTGNGFCTAVDAPYAGCTTDETSVVSAWIDLLHAE